MKWFKRFKFTRVSQTTISGIVGTFAGIVWALLPYMQNSTNPKVQAIAGLLMVLGFGNASRAAADQSTTPTTERLEGKPDAAIVHVGDIRPEADATPIDLSSDGGAGGGLPRL